MIDAIQGHNKKVFLQRSKLSEFDVEVKKLEGISSSKIKRDLIEARRRVER